MNRNGRYGSYDPRTPYDKAKARRENQQRQKMQAQVLAFKRAHELCINGCGKPAAWFPGGQTLLFAGACSAECMESHAATNNVGLRQGPR